MRRRETATCTQGTHITPLDPSINAGARGGITGGDSIISTTKHHPPSEGAQDVTKDSPEQVVSEPQCFLLGPAPNKFNKNINDAQGKRTSLIPNYTRRANTRAPPGIARHSLQVHGANARSVFTPENFYFLNKFLTEQQPDLLFAVETWHQEDKMKNMLDTGYKGLYSAFSDERGGGTAIIFKNTLLVAPLFPDLHTHQESVDGETLLKDGWARCFAMHISPPR